MKRRKEGEAEVAKLLVLLVLLVARRDLKKFLYEGDVNVDVVIFLALFSPFSLLCIVTGS